VISRWTAILALLALFGTAFQAHALSLNGRYFVVVWGYQGASNDPADAHTFAAFYRGDDLAAGNGRAATISWLPAAGVVTFGRVERGRNLSLGETLAFARRHHYSIASYGPFEISPQTYSRAVARIHLLNSGALAYTMINGPANAMNCIEAAGSVGGPIFTGLRYGFAASAAVASHLALNQTVDPNAAARLHLHSSAAAQRLTVPLAAGGLHGESEHVSAGP
jgi:hypothetical protein